MEEIRQDRISSLPDNLIHHILSFIDTKYAVQTSVLSKRWKTTWISLPYLNFTWSGFIEGKDNLNDSSSRSEELIRFIDFVYMVFMFRDDSDIQTLKIYLDWNLWTTPTSDEISRSLNRWIIAAVRRHVTELSINIDYNHELAYELPHQLLNCESLRKLSIFGGTGTKYANIVLPKSISLPQLKQLLLVGVSISFAELTQSLLNRSPLFELLIVVNCDLQSDNQEIDIVDCFSYEHFGEAHFGRYFLWQNHTVVNTIKVPAPNLIAFDCKDFLTQNFPSAADARFSMMLRENKKDESAEIYSKLPAEEKKVYAKRLIKLLQAVPNVVRLSLSSGFLEDSVSYTSTWNI
ncbi:hypothetical protein C5167_051074 [Papaver somniferum]|uniref:F-box domain-containing protein n=1 Tax=Papaver somniferum TaxID=3469 RepID=A0A4Y7KTY8_PAPSO|nr:hypothetical protein C5167_051074 [Papaver somniferum]